MARDNIGYRASQAWASFWHSLYFQHGWRGYWWIGLLPALPGMAEQLRKGGS